MRLTMKKWKIALLSVIFSFVALLGLLAWNMGTQSPFLQANAATASDYGLVMDNGASIRVVGSTGIRFSASIDEAQASNATEYGMLVSDKDYLNGQDLTVDTAKWTISSASDMNVVAENGRIRFNGVLTNVKDHNLTKAYVARAFVKDASGTYYTTTIERSPFAVAVAAYEDGYTQTAVQDYIVLDVTIDGTGAVSVARNYATIGGTTITASGNVGAADPTLNNISCAGTNFYGLIVNGKRIVMGGNSVAEIGGKSYEFTGTSVNNNKFSGISTAHAHAYAWNDDAADKDIYVCACGDIEKTFTKDYTQTRKDLNFGSGASTMQMPFETGSLTAAKLDDGTVLTVADSHVEFESIRTDLQKHGNHTLYVGVRDGDFTHETKFSIRLITRTFAGNAERDAFREATRGVAATCTADNPKLYGYYILTADLDATWTDTGFVELWSGTLPNDSSVGEDGKTKYTARNDRGFAGTIIGEKADGSTPVIKGVPKVGGVFGHLVGATIKNIIFDDIYFQGSAGKALVSTIAMDTTFEDVTFKITGVNTTAAAQSTTGWGMGWIINNEIRNVTFRNVSFVNATANAITVGRLLTDQNDRKVTFENCAIGSNLTITNVYGSTAITAVTGIDFNGHIHVYEYVGDAAGHIGKCTVGDCNATTEKEAHYGGSASCGGGAECVVCGKVYTGAMAGVHTNFVWNKLDGKDIYWCEGCHTIKKEVRTDYTDVIMSVDFGKGETSIGLPLAGYGELQTAVLDGVGEMAAGTVTLTSADFSAYKEDLQKHGERNLRIIVNNEGHEHTINFTVRLITRTFAGTEDRAEFIEATRGVRATCTADNPKLYGCYILSADLDAAWGASGFAELYTTTLPESTSYGFAGTIIGEKADGSAPVISTTPRSGGVFGYLVGATIKNIIFDDIYFQGSAGAALVSTIAMDTTFEDVTFKITGVNTGAAAQATEGWGKGWIINNEINNVTFRNVNFVNATANAITVGRLLTNQNDRKVTFENCNVTSNLTITNVYGTTAMSSMSGITFNVDHIHTYTYAQSASGHIGTCTYSDCGATTVEEAHYGGIANCGQGAICAVCGYEYTAKSEASHGAYVWSEEEGKDVYACQVCGDVAKEFITDYTATAIEINQYNGATLNVTSYFAEGATYSNFTFNGVALSGNASAISFANVTDKAKHGVHELTFTVTVEGQAHNVRFTVCLITRTFVAGEEAAFREATRGVRATCTEANPLLYGYYVLAMDLDTRWSTNGYGALYSGTLPASDNYGFAGTIIGRKADGSAPVIKVTSKSGGMFGYLVGATVKNVIFEEDEHVGTYYATGTDKRPILATVAKNVTIEDVTFKIISVADSGTQETSGWGIGWIINNTVSNLTFRNVSFVNETANDIIVGRMIPGAATFENCQVTSNLTFTVIYGSVDSVSGLTSVTHIHTYDYVGTASGHIGTCTYPDCGATTVEEAHYGGVASCEAAGTCALCGYVYIPAGSGEHNFDGTKYVGDETNHYLACTICGGVDEESAVAHSGGSATCASGAICEVCGTEYGEVSTTHTGTFAWTVGEYADEKCCSVCGLVEESFHTDYTANRLDVDQAENPYLDVSAYFASGASVSNIYFNGVALSGTLNEIDFSSVTDLSKHGDANLEMTVTVNGQAHDVRFFVRLITRSFGENQQSELAAVARGIRTADQTSIYGFYRITADLNCRTNQGFTELWSADLPEKYYGFAGTIYGEKADGSTPILSVQSKSGGTFGYLVGATLENLIFEDIYYRGSALSGAIISAIAYNCTFKDVTFRVKTLNTDAYADLAAINAAQVSNGWGYGWLISNETVNNTFTNIVIESAIGDVQVGRVFGGNNGNNSTAKDNTFTNCALMNVEYVNFIGLETSTEGVFTPVNVIVVDIADGATEPTREMTKTAFDLQTIMKALTGLSWIVQDEHVYSSTTSNFVNTIVLGSVADFEDSVTMTANAKALGGASYAMKADGTTVYLCGANDNGVENAMYEFLYVYFACERFSPSYYTANHEAWTDESTFDATRVPDRSAGVKQAYLNNGYRGTLTGDAIQQMRYNGDIAVDLLMSIEEGVHNSKMHNSFYWLPAETYKGSHAKWYAKEETKNFLGITSIKQKYNDLCYTAQGDSTQYQAMIAECVKVAKNAVQFSENQGKYYLPFLKQDVTSACVCDACKDMEAQYGSKSATVVKFMNDLMAAIEADSEITRTDFDLVFFAYEGFEYAPTGMTLDDRVTVWIAAPYSFNYQKDINDATDEINVKGKANLKAWSDMSTSGDLWLWTYSTNFNNYMMPIDTFAFYNENAYNFFRECNVTMMYSQSQISQTGTMTAWHNLKMYLDGRLMKDPSATQEDLIATYMTATFGDAASAMTNFFNSVREYTALSNHSELDNYYASNKYGAYTILAGQTLEESKYWSQAKVEEWLNYCEQAYAAIAPLQSTNVTEYNRIKANIDAEWISPAYISVMLGYDTSLKTELLEKINAFGMTRYRELYEDLIEHIG